MAFNYSPKVITDGLVLYLDAANTRSYPGTGTAWNDLSRSGNNGTLTNGPTFNSGNGGSIVFDGVDDYVNCGSQKVNNTSFTFSCWVKLAIASGTQVFIAQGSTGAGSYQYIAFRNNLFQFNTDGSNTFAESNSTPSANIWYNIVGVYNTTVTNKNIIYVNSIPQTTVSTATANFTGDSTSLGRSPFGSGGAFLNGNIANAQIYNRALSSTEILQNYNATKTRFGL